MSFTQVVRSRRTDSNNSRPRILAGNPVDRASGASQASVNADVADAFDEMAGLLVIRGENPFRVRAYQRAAIVVSSQPRAQSSRDSRC